MQIINCTPHPIRIYSKDTPDTVADVETGVTLELPPSGQFARLAEKVTSEDTATVDGVKVPVAEVSYAEVQGLPEPHPAKRYVVPLVTALAARGRDDLLTPYDQVRNTEGAVVGCRRLGRVVG